MQHIHSTTIPSADSLRRTSRLQACLEDLAKRVKDLSLVPYICVALEGNEASEGNDRSYNLTQEEANAVEKTLKSRGYFCKKYIAHYVNTNRCHDPSRCFAYHPPVYAPKTLFAVALSVSRLPSDADPPSDQDLVHTRRSTLAYVTSS